MIDGGSRGAVGVATQVAGDVDVAEADTCAGNADSQHEWGVNMIGLKITYILVYIPCVVTRNGQRYPGPQ